MRQAQWERLEDLFAKAVELSAAERDAFVSRETADDPDLRDELSELLECDPGNSTGPLTYAMGAALDATSRQRREALVGSIIRNYRIDSVLGYGGTGTVYLAERVDRQYSAQVAIKVVDTATVQGDLGVRFRAERQILASLNHPNISRLLDAGETAEGQPFLVMEYIQGEQLDRFAERQTLDLRRRLQLFLEICSAVQYAHQNLVVHRDLKPANILVTADGVPKLLDFGIAKLLDSADASAVIALTRIDDRLLTPEYASPEQILARPVTTATDVYALGVVLYELLTGLHPFKVSVATTELELERLICRSDPERPSAAIRSLKLHGGAEAKSQIAAITQARGVSVEKLHRQLRGDLDAIVMRALRKEPQHRYASVEQFAADIRRHLGNEPVNARQGNWRYYSQRFIRRHAVGVAAAVTFVSIGIVFLIATTIQTKRIATGRDLATQESLRAEAVSDFMLEVFSASDPFTSQGRETTAHELLDNAAQRLRSDLTQQPEVRARLLEAIGKSYRRQDAFKQAVAALQEALRIRKQLPDPDGSKTSSTLVQLELAQRVLGDTDGARTSLEEAQRLLEEGHNEHSILYATVLQEFGRLEVQNGNLMVGRAYFERSLPIYREITGNASRDVASTIADLDSIALWNDDLKSAESLARQALGIYEQVLPELHPDRVGAESRLVEILVAEGQYDEAASRLERVLEHAKSLYGATSRQVAGGYAMFADVSLSQERLAEAENYSRKCLHLIALRLGDEHYTTAYMRAALGEILLKRAKLDEAESLLRHALATYSKTLPVDHQYVASSEYFLGEVLLKEGRLADAESMLTSSMNRWNRVNAPPWRSRRSESALGEVLYREGKYEEAERHLLGSYQALASDEKADRAAQVQARERLALFYRERGEPSKFEAFVRTMPPLESAAVSVAPMKR